MRNISPAIIVLNQNSVALARKIISILPEATLYGLIGRTSDTDITFSNFGETLRGLFAQSKPIIGICAAGILIRTLAPILTNKQQEPAVIAIAEDGSAVVPLLGGLQGVNQLAHRIATALNIHPAITTTGDIRFRTALLSPPPGYTLANPDDAKTFISDLLAGNNVKIEGEAPWLTNGQLPVSPHANLTIQITANPIKGTPQRLIYHPATIAIAIGDISQSMTIDLTLIKQLLDNAQLTIASIGGIFAPTRLARNSTLHALAQSLAVPMRFLTPKELQILISQGHSLTEAIAIKATGKAPSFSPNPDIAIAIARNPINAENIGQPQGRLNIIGTGPGNPQWMSPQVKAILQSATDIVGYKTYLNLLGSLVDGKERHESDNREEIPRAIQALDLAAQGRSVAVVSSGDPGIYAMAAAVFEAYERCFKPEWESIDIHIAPGISAMQAAAAAMGAPLGHDFCVISLSDILKPWSIIKQRIIAAAAADLAIAFYNPVSSERSWQLSEAKNILLDYRDADTPVILGQNLGRTGEQTKVIKLQELSPKDADMRTVILIGSSQTKIITRLDNSKFVYTPRKWQPS